VREIKPSATLFVVNFDPARVRERDLDNLFSKYGEQPEGERQAWPT
jgi:hypothetical protein